MKNTMIIIFGCLVLLGFTYSTDAKDYKHYGYNYQGYNYQGNRSYNDNYRYRNGSPDVKNYRNYDNNYRDNKSYNDNQRYRNGSSYYYDEYRHNNRYERSDRKIRKEIRRNEVRIQKLERKIWELRQYNNYRGRHYYRNMEKIRNMEREIYRLRERNRDLWQYLRNR